MPAITGSSQRRLHLSANISICPAASSRAGLTFAPYPKTGGWTFSFQTHLEGASWNDYVVDIIALGQRVAYASTPSGDIGHSPEGCSTSPRIAGMTAIQWQVGSLEHVDATGANDIGLYDIGLYDIGLYDIGR